MNKAIEWLFDGCALGPIPDPSQDLLEQSESDPAVVADRQAMLADPQIQALLTELAGWPGPALHRHNDAGHLLHKLVFISDLGLIAQDKGADAIIRNILQRQSKEGAFEVMANISPRFGGSGQDQLAWMLCDAPSVLYSLVKLGLGENSAVQSAAGHLASLCSENGWPCVVSPEFGNFRGPGRKTDPCPYATLISLKALAQFPAWRESQACQNGARALLSLWEQRRERRPYLFAMGTDFTKLKAPLIWYDILHVLKVLTQFPFLQKDQRFLEMVDIMRKKSDNEGRFTAASAWKAWSNWEFGQKKVPSFWLTLQAHRILKRVV